jgi:hypothetical protein
MAADERRLTQIFEGKNKNTHRAIPQPSMGQPNTRPSAKPLPYNRGSVCFDGLEQAEVDFDGCFGGDGVAVFHAGLKAPLGDSFESLLVET